MVFMINIQLFVDLLKKCINYTSNLNYTLQCLFSKIIQLQSDELIEGVTA